MKSKALLAVVLSGCLILSACTVSQFEAVLNEVAPAVTTVIEIIALVKGVPANTAPAAKIASDVAGLEALYTTWQTDSAAAKPGIEGQINAGFAVLQSDLTTVFSIAQVSDPNTQAKITALVGLIDSAVQIAEAAIPNSTPKSLKPLTLDANGLVVSWNQILTAKTGNVAVDSYTPKHKLHVHGKFLRLVTVGIVK